MEPIEADDACVDAKHDKGVDAIYVNDVSETAFVIQAKIRTKDEAEFGDTDLKEFYGTLQQFDSKKWQPFAATLITQSSPTEHGL